MRCSRYRPISEGATGRPPIYPGGFQPKEFNQRDLPYVHHTRGWRSQDETPGPLGLSDQSRRDPSCNALRAAI
jgi:hypothetical protein